MTSLPFIVLLPPLSVLFSSILVSPPAYSEFEETNVVKSIIDPIACNLSSFTFILDHPKHRTATSLCFVFKHSQTTVGQGQPSGFEESH